MKLLGLSMVAVVAMSSVAFGADSLADAFKDGSLKGQLKAYYADRENDTVGVDASLLSLGVKLDYETAAYHNFKLGLGIQASNSPFADEDAKVAFGTVAGATNGGYRDLYGPGAVLSQAYLSYAFDKTALKVGRQYIKMPLLASSGSRLVLQSFEGATLISKAIPDTTVMAAFVQKFHGWTSGTGSAPKFTTIPDAYSIAIINKSLPNTTITAAYGDKEDAYSILYADTKYAGKTDIFGYTVAAQYSETNNETAIADANYYGLKFGASFGAFSAYIAYAEVQDGTAKYAVAGTGSKPTIFTATLWDVGQYNESEQYAFDAKYSFSNLGLTLEGRYVNVDKTVGEQEYLAGKVTYVSKELKGLSTQLIYEQEELDSTSVDDQMWFKAVYSF